MKRKWLAIGIILLFIGVTVAPSINQSIVTASQEDDLVEVTTQACGIQGYGDTTVKLTRQQYQDLEEYLVEFRARLNQTTTREEAVPIFKDAVVELHKYGLLPKGMSVEQAQKLVTGRFQKSSMKENIKGLANETNSMCLIEGTHEDAFTMHIFLFNLLLIIDKLAGMIYNSDLSSLITDIIQAIVWSDVFQKIDFLTSIYFWGGHGSITTIGLLGLRSWTGFIEGGFRKLPGTSTIHLGVIGFTGFHITNMDYNFNMHIDFIGSALYVNIISYPY
jgi:hypothetical protein